ncbi:hypothetical protein Asp14428_25120 [Actinoplanes sp. NBRC 14428]|uniref:Uncharacterized protein n=1 Tax=Pseudosporangium ferrugineum TaxID=439699 RepID=A0A2T0S9S2_9ACTN|nr:hypothetical protein [Pseudosporangium ferrugineum]PRY30063.1 hypothetical protein CLV70_105232 [Pseudosporangium ferrugineum]BCJ51037.1 hypothetical protein Asp14428_25120 [Actinoplanes sp. NBRC 14428]
MRPGDRTMPPAARGLSRSGAGQFRLRLLTGLTLVVVLAMLVTVVLLNDRGPDGEDATGDVVRVGVVEGQSVSGYLRSSQSELAALLPSPGSPVAGPTWALVSLAGYYPPGKLPAVLDGAAIAQVYVRAAPLANVRTPVLKLPVYRMPEDVVTGMQNAAVAREQERADYLKLAGELAGDGPEELRLRAAYESAAQTAAAEAAAFRAQCACVFAAVVRAEPAALAQLAGRAEVRVVDPAPEVRRLDRTEFRPVLPEQTTTVPDDDTSGSPVPSQDVTVAPASLAPLPSSSRAGSTSAPSGGSAREPGPSSTAPEESAAVPSAPSVFPGPDVPLPVAGASRGASGR